MLAVIALGLIGIGLGGGVVRLFRKRLLSFRYFAGWLCVAVLLLCCAAAVAVLGGLSPRQETIVGTVFAAFVFALLVQLSISISGLQRQVRDLVEAQALSSLRPRVEDPSPAGCDSE